MPELDDEDNDLLLLLGIGLFNQEFYYHFGIRSGRTDQELITIVWDAASSAGGISNVSQPVIGIDYHWFGNFK